MPRPNGTPLTLAAVTGLPCVGKSEIATEVARRAGLFLVELDHLEAPLLRQGIDGDALGWAGYDMLAALAVDNLTIGFSVILDAVGWTTAVRERWSAVAAEANARYRPIRGPLLKHSPLSASCGTTRRQLPGYPDTTWEDIHVARGRYEPWQADRLILDSVQPLPGLIEQATNYVLRD
jgi:predicted kinase